MSFGNPNQGGGGYPPADLRGQGGWNREGFELENEGEARARYEAATEKDAAELTKPSALGRLKRWLSAKL